MDEFWVLDRSFKGSNKAPPTIIAKRNEPKPTRQALPTTIECFVADHVEKGRQVNQRKIKCKGGETPDKQAELVSKAFSKPMEISDWKEESDGLITYSAIRTEGYTQSNGSG
jgi:hypothetical protein